MTLYDKRIPVKGKFVKETSGYREADVQDFLQKLKEAIKEKGWFCNPSMIDELAGEELAFVNVLEGEA